MELTSSSSHYPCIQDHYYDQVRPAWPGRSTECPVRGKCPSIYEDYFDNSVHKFIGQNWSSSVLEQQQ